MAGIRGAPTWFAMAAWLSLAAATISAPPLAASVSALQGPGTERVVLLALTEEVAVQLGT